jgi:hypothetical protein
MMVLSARLESMPCLDCVLKGQAMHANERNEMNNQTENGANEKWQAGAKGKTSPDAPLDHTYAHGAAGHGTRQGVDQMGSGQSGMGPGQFAEDSSRWDLPGGSMQTQQSGGSGPQQGISDSHQRQMAQHSSAYGELEQPVGRRAAGSGTSVRAQQADGAASVHATGRSQMNPAGHAARQDNSDQSGAPHVSNDTTGGLPRSPGNTGPAGDAPGWQPAASKVDAPDGVHESNDAAGGYPKSPAGANRLAGDQKMDDDTGFSRH